MLPLHAHIAVIGAGPSGITAVKNLLDAGFTNIVCFDRNEAVGGNWLFRLESSHSSVFETTHIISSRTLSQYHDYPMPSSYPDYPSHEQLARYFQSYADHFGVTRHVRFATDVLRVDPQPDDRWKLTVRTGADESHDVFDAVHAGVVDHRVHLRLVHHYHRLAASAWLRVDVHRLPQHHAPAAV